MRFYYRQKWMLLAAMTLGSALQLTTCREELALFGLRSAFSAYTLPIDVFLRQLIFGVV